MLTAATNFAYWPDARDSTPRAARWVRLPGTTIVQTLDIKAGQPAVENADITLHKKLGGAAENVTKDTQPDNDNSNPQPQKFVVGTVARTLPVPNAIVGQAVDEERKPVAGVRRSSIPS